MKKNVGNIDRVLRIVLAIAVLGLYFTGQITGTAAVILGVGAVIFMFTGATGWCAIYSITGLSTCKVKDSTE